MKQGHGALGSRLQKNVREVREKHARLKHNAKWGFIVTMGFENHATRVNIVPLGPGPTKALAPTIV